MEKIIKALNFEVKDINEEERSFTAVASTEDIDRDGDRIMATGWNLENFMKNPVVPWAHDYREPPVARAAEVWVEEGRLMFKPKFPAPGDYPFADVIWKLYRGGFLRAFSVGFRPTRRELVERSKGIRGWDFMEQELWEISACTVPSNPNALVAAKSAGLVSDEEAALVAKMEKDAAAIGGGHDHDVPPGAATGASTVISAQAGIQDPGPGTPDLAALLADSSRKMEAFIQALNTYNERMAALTERLAGFESAVAALQPQPEDPAAIRAATGNPDDAQTLTPDMLDTAVAQVLQGAEERIGKVLDDRVKYHLGKS